VLLGRLAEGAVQRVEQMIAPVKPPAVVILFDCRLFWQIQRRVIERIANHPVAHIHERLLTSFTLRADQPGGIGSVSSHCQVRGHQSRVAALDHDVALLLQHHGEAAQGIRPSRYGMGRSGLRTGPGRRSWPAGRQRCPSLDEQLVWCARQDSNLQPSGYEPPALTN
jgi:hypothetical protein